MNTLNRVENILRVSEKSRSSDKELLIIYMNKMGMDLSERQIEIFKNMPAFESITRARRILQEQGKYPASKEVDEARFKKFQEMRQSPSYTLEYNELTGNYERR